MATRARNPTKALRMFVMSLGSGSAGRSSSYSIMFGGEVGVNHVFVLVGKSKAKVLDANFSKDMEDDPFTESKVQQLLT